MVRLTLLISLLGIFAVSTLAKPTEERLETAIREGDLVDREAVFGFEANSVIEPDHDRERREAVVDEEDDDEEDKDDDDDGDYDANEPDEDADDGKSGGLFHARHKGEPVIERAEPAEPMAHTEDGGNAEENGETDPGE